METKSGFGEIDEDRAGGRERKEGTVRRKTYVMFGVGERYIFTARKAAPWTKCELSGCGSSL